MPSQKIIVGLDLDGVLYNFHSAFYEFYKTEFGYTGGIKDFWNVFWKSLCPERQAYLVSIPIAYETEVVSRDVHEFFDHILPRVYDVFYITSRSEDLRRVTERFFRRNNLPKQENLIMTKSKGIECARFGVTHFLDDMGKHVEDTGKVCNSYLKAAIHNTEERKLYNTVYSLREFADRVLETV